MMIRAFDVADTEAVVALWKECNLTRPWNDPRADIRRKLSVQPELFLVGVEPSLASPNPIAGAGAPEGEAIASATRSAEPDPTTDPGASVIATATRSAEPDPTTESGSSVIASAMVGYDGHRGWINYLAVSPAWQRRGYARALMLEAEQLLTALGCPKLNLQVRQGNSEALGFYRALGYEPDLAVSFGKRLIHD